MPHDGELSDRGSNTYIGLHVKYLLILSSFNESWIFLYTFSTNPLIQNFMKIHPMAAEFFHADGRTDGYMVRYT